MCPEGFGCATETVSGVVVPEPDACNDFESLVIPVGDEELCLGEQAQVSFTWAICL